MGADLQGEGVSASTTYWYEGATYNAYFAFNDDGFGTLRVSGDDGFEGFIGPISEADIFGGTFPDVDEA